MSETNWVGVILVVIVAYALGACAYVIRDASKPRHNRPYYMFSNTPAKLYLYMMLAWLPASVFLLYRRQYKLGGTLVLWGFFGALIWGGFAII